jgi:hypothetical protein
MAKVRKSHEQQEQEYDKRGGMFLRASRAAEKTTKEPKIQTRSGGLFLRSS